ncbi:MAG: ShlB/FhaC/HecB family hemolysin secretion/activation protein [Phycisphaerae bacterium]|nr:ShlB/FhaC/HecB family hemolysin secretion/activation protein [Phycisphaerae bacterium]
MPNERYSEAPCRKSGPKYEASRHGDCPRAFRRGRGGGRAGLLSLVAGTALGLSGGVVAGSPAGAAVIAVQPGVATADRPELTISSFAVVFEPQHPGLPPLEEILKEAQVTLVRTNEGFAVFGPEEARGQASVADVNEHLKENGPTKFSIEAVRAIFKSLGNVLAGKQLLGVFITTDPDEVQLERDPETGRDAWVDQRDPEGEMALRVKILIPVVTGLRTVAAGERLGSEEQRVNNPVHDRVREGSPLQPRPDSPDAPRKDLLRRDQLDDYVFRLNRHPGRRVDVALSNASETEVGAVVLDYLVRENKPWIIYLQASNTGTAQTSEWRERAGFIHNQLLSNDDTLSLDYTTGGFDTAHIINGGYEFPLTSDGKLRLAIGGGYNEFDASEVGQSNENFSGSSYTVSGELSYNIYQNRELFIDVYGGGRFQNVEVTNNTLGVGLTGETDFALFGGGLRLERNTEIASTNVKLGFEFNASDVAGTDPAELQRLGRLNTDEDFVLFQFSAEQTLYLEPIFDSGNYAAGKSTLAHEVAFMLRGQATSERVSPTFQQVAGGLYSVRGYDESVAAGDSVVIATIEYRLHIPRLLDTREPGIGLFGEEFRWAPEQPYGRPDWDLIFRAFVDAGKTVNSERLTFERDEELLSAGVGLELVFKRNLNIRVDWGHVLEDVGTGRGRNESGDNRFHIVATLLF